MDTQIIYTCPGKGHANRKSIVQIDWDGVSREQLITLAKARILSRLQLSFKRDNHFPERITVSVLDFVQPDVEYKSDCPIPHKPKQKEITLIDKLMESLSVEERKVLLGQLETGDE